MKKETFNECLREWSKHYCIAWGGSRKFGGIVIIKHKDDLHY